MLVVVLVVNTAPGSRGLRHPEHGQPWVLPSTCPLLASCCCGAQDLLPPMLPGLGGLSTDPSWGGSTHCSVWSRGTLSGSCTGSAAALESLSPNHRHYSQGRGCKLVQTQLRL